MPAPQTKDIILAGPGGKFEQPEGTYTVNPDGVSYSFAAHPKVGSQFSLNGKRYQLDENGQPQEIADNSKPVTPKTVKDNRGNIYSQDPITGELTLSQAGAPSTTSVAGGSSVARTDPMTGQTTFTQAPLSPSDQLKQQIDYFDAQVKQGKLAREAAQGQLDDWIARNINMPKETATATQSLATATQTGDINALTANRALIKDKYDNALATSVYNLQPGWWKTYGQPGGAQPDVVPVNAYAKALQALDGISPYATALNNAKAQLNLPGNTQTGTPPPVVPAATVPQLPALTPEQQAALGGQYTPPPGVLPADYIASRNAALNVG